MLDLSVLSSRTILAVVLCAIGTPGLMRAGPINLVTNGGFETGNFNGWTAGADESVPCSGGTSHSCNCAALIAGADAGFSQGIATPGASYNLDFWAEWFSGGTLGQTSILFVTWGAQIVLDLNVPLPPLGVYEHYSFTNLTPDPSSTVLAFFEPGGNGQWLIDDVNVEASAVPEPTTGPMLFAGLAALIVAAWFVRKPRSLASLGRRKAQIEMVEAAGVGLPGDIDYK